MIHAKFCFLPDSLVNSQHVCSSVSAPYQMMHSEICSLRLPHPLPDSCCTALGEQDPDLHQFTWQGTLSTDSGINRDIFLDDEQICEDSENILRGQISTNINLT